jgi:hypothetical protein
VQTAHEAGLSDRSVPDREVLAFAASHRLALLTLNRRHFMRLHAEQPNHAGIVACRFDPDFAGQADRIHAMIEAEQPLDRKMLRVNRPG